MFRSVYNVYIYIYTRIDTDVLLYVQTYLIDHQGLKYAQGFSSGNRIQGLTPTKTIEA